MDNAQAATDQHQEDFVFRYVLQPRQQARITGKRDAGGVDVGFGMRTRNNRAGMSVAHEAHRRGDIVDGGPPARSQWRSRTESLTRQRIDGQQGYMVGPGGRPVERADGEIFRAELRIEPDDKFVAHQNNRWSTLTDQLRRGLDRDFRPDAIGIANGQCDDRPGHSGSASSVSMRELSHTTVRSFSFTSPSWSL